jgi:hypothetical protein
VGTAAPSNDDFANAAALTPGGGSLTADNTGATKEAGEPDHAGDRGGASLWYTWTPSFGGTASIDTSGSAIDTLLAVYTGTSLSTLTTVATNDDVADAGGPSRVCFIVDTSKTYKIAVDGFDDDEGAITLTYGPKTDSAPCPTLPPAIMGPAAAPKVGDRLFMGTGVYSDASATTVVRSWARCVAEVCTEVGSSPSYVIQPADLGAVIREHETLAQASGSASSDSDPTGTVGITPSTHANGRIYWVTKTLVSSLRIDSMLPDGTDLKQVTATGVAPNFSDMPAVSPDGSTVAFVNLGNGGSHVETMNADGSNIHDLGFAGTWPSWSPDGSRIAFVSQDGIDSVDRNGNELLLVPLAPGQPVGPLDWSPDGRNIAFGYHFPGTAQGDVDIAVISASGMGAITQLTNSPAVDRNPAWSPTGDRIAFERGPDSGSAVSNGDLYVMNPDGSNQTLLYDGNATNSTPATGLAQDGVDWSPDGTKILFSINSGFGTSQLYTIPAGGGIPTQLPGDGYQNSLLSWGVAFTPSAGGGAGSGGGGGGGGGAGAMTVSVNPGSQTVSSGGTATFTITVTNTGGGYVYGGGASAPNAPSCNHALESPAEPGLLPPNGYTLSYTCSVSGVTASFTNAITASGKSQNGDTITATGSAQVTVNAAPAPPPTPPLPSPPPPKPVAGKTITGTAHADHLTGTAGNDVIKGLGGNDVLNGGKGTDTIFGGNGNDKITGGPGTDKLYGGPGNDTINAADGTKDTIDCGPGTDNVAADKIDTVAKNCEHVHRSSSL